MNTKAIYTVHENGKEHYFFSEHAGGFSYPSLFIRQENPSLHHCLAVNFQVLERTP